MTIKVVARYALHTSGTKFYHVVSFQTGQKSFALRHYGKSQLFIKPGNMSLGSMELDTPLQLGLNAGISKFLEKQKGGYTDQAKLEQWEFSTVMELKQFINTHFGPKSKKIAFAWIDHPDFVSDLSHGIPSVSATVAPKVKEPDEAPVVKHPEWGTW